MLQLRYPSTAFAAAWAEALRKGVDFSVEAKISKFKLKSIHGLIDFMSGEGGNGLSLLGSALFCGQLHVCVTKAIGTKQYDVGYSIIESGTVIKFHRRGS